MHYVVKRDGVSVLKTRGDLTNVNGDVVGHDHYSVVHLAGDVVSADDLSPALVSKLKANDAHVVSLLEPVNDKNAQERSDYYRAMAATQNLPKAVEQPVLPTAAPGVIQVDKAADEAGQPTAGEVDTEAVPHVYAEEEVDDSVKPKGGKGKSA